ncbi:hypothetical protein, conserved [Eimeria praecox]|uniref:Choline transporter-like protein n=1 Tax=Eimeria praecox TaxID=51316 RepID=U6H0U0_9EIME|nr:hypothetical protein, conserved [Eimeria praecox]
MQTVGSPDEYSSSPFGMGPQGYPMSTSYHPHDGPSQHPGNVVQGETYEGMDPASAGPVATVDAEPKRRVTDHNWFLAFVAFMLLCSFFVLLAFTEGSPARLYKGMNYQGKTCGVDPEVRDLPYLYFPLDPRESFASIMTSDARCVAKCPTQEDVDNGLTIPTPMRETSIDGSKTSVVTAEYLLLSPAYASTLMADAYCIPLDPSLRSQLVPVLNNTFRQLQFAIGSFVNSWGCVFGYLLLAVFFSIIFSASIRLSPGLLFGSAAAGSIGLAFLAGGVLIKSGFSGVLDQDKGNFYSLDYALAMFVGFALLAIGCFLLAALFVARRAIATALRVMECTAQALGDMQQVFLTPLFFSAATIVWVGLWLWAYVYMVSAGRVGATEIPMGLDQNGDIGILPLHREFVWDVRFMFFGVLWWLALFWVVEALMAFAHFVISYTATVWYFSPPEGADERDVGWFPPLVAIGLGSIHHLGSFAVGGLVMGVTRPIRLLFPWAATKHLASTEDLPVVQSLRSSFRSIMSPLSFIVDRFTSSGYIEVVAIASAIGSLFVSLLIGIMIYSTLTATEKYSSIASSSFVAAPLCVSIFTAATSFMIALHSMSIWDIVADTFMYCFLVESVQPPVVDENPLTKVHAPACLRELLLNAQTNQYHSSEDYSPLLLSMAEAPLSK